MIINGKNKEMVNAIRSGNVEAVKKLLVSPGIYNVFQGFEQALLKLNCGSVLGSSLFLLMSELPLKMMLVINMVKNDSKSILD
jgi:hypothetical protein